MKARQKPSVKQRKMLEREIAEIYKEQYEKSERVSAYRMMLIVLHTLRFEFGWKKRLNDLFIKIAEDSKDIDKWKKADILAEVYLNDLEASGCDFQGAFDELIEHEQEVYKMHCDEEKAIRKAKTVGK